MPDENPVAQGEVVQSADAVPAVEPAPAIDAVPAAEVEAVPVAAAPKPMPEEALHTETEIVSPPTVPVPATPIPTVAAPVSTPASPHFGKYSVKEAQDKAKAAHADIFEHKAEKMLAYVKAHGSIDRKQAELLLHVSPNSAYLYLKRLTKEGRLRKEGSGVKTSYVLI